MVRIRKKTSKRKTTAHRAKVKHKTAETKKKRRKEAKNNPNLRKKKKKDPGIPNSFPFKEQILAEVAEARRLALEEKRRKQEQKEVDVTGDTSNAATKVVELQPKLVSLPQRMEVDDVPLLIDTTIPTITVALEVADVIVYLLDARDPLSFRNSSLEDLVADKPLIFVLSKADLAPREAISSWLSYLRKSRPAVLFRATSTYRTSETSQFKSKPKNGALESDILGRELFLEVLHTIAPSQAKSEPKVAVVGITNVGKSSFINSLVGKPALPVYNPIGPKTTTDHATTPYPQSINLSHKKRKFTFIDTPGLSFIPQVPSTAEETEQRIARDILLRNRGNISKIRDPLPAALYILSRASMEDLLILYNLPAVGPGDYDGFLASLARKEGALQKRGAVVDFQGAAKALVRDWKTGRLAFYTFPPKSNEEETSTSQSSTRFDLTETYQKHDERLLGELLPRKELRRTHGTIIQLKGATLDGRRVDLEAEYGSADDQDSDEEGNMVVDEENLSEGSDEESDASDEDVDSDEVSGEEDKNEDDEEESGEEEEDSEEIEDIPILSSKQKRLAQRQGKHIEKPAPAKKTVSFAPYTKAGAKMKKTKKGAQISEKALPVTRSLPTTAAGKKSKASSLANSQNSTDDPDAYDFSKYF
ncbi:hypothetical protein FRC19_005116 [Serendipita sp. 401]|nr:hypothetical protein FRC19_005116 [Serendipita sp. 401]